MKITNDIEQSIDILQIIEDLKEKNPIIYWNHINGQIFIYKPLGRRDFKEIASNTEISEVEKEDEVVKRTLLYPYDLDLDDIPAGIVSNLFRTIMENSYLPDVGVRAEVLNYFRSEMFDIQEQITCIINEAFPQFDIEEIENWGIERTSKYLSRAEWKLQNLRGAVINYDYIEQMQQSQEQVPETDPMQNNMNERNIDRDNSSPSNNKKQKLTPQKLAELKAKFPEIDWEADVIANEGIEGMRDHVDTVAPALRVNTR